MNLFLVLGNQLFPLSYFEHYKKDHLFFMSEDFELCTYEKHHKNKILFYLSSMRSFHDNLIEKNFKTKYLPIEDQQFKVPYTEKLISIIKKNKISKVTSFEIEDKMFEKKIERLFTKEKIYWNILQTPMFLNSRIKFQNYISTTKKPLMFNFYKQTRKEMNILVDKDNLPLGGKWSFDDENRKKLPKKISIPKFPNIKRTNHTIELESFVEKEFKDHPGSTKDFCLATERKDVVKILDFFLKSKINLFGDYEDAVDTRDNILFHSTLSSYINIGLITPEYIIKRVLNFHKKNNINLNSLEGFIRQIIGWREFMRGIYQNYSEKLEKGNYFQHSRKMKKSWYEGTTGIDPLDYAIKNASKYGWSHHIERLMILANIMNLCEIKPKIVYKWFMEMFTDSSEWVMYPNVYGMGLFSDGGIFSTKPYICGSNYILKMTDFRKGDWCDTMDGLYWRFIKNNRIFFKSNPRLNMMVRILDSMDKNKKERIFSSAEKFIKKNTLK